MEGGEEEDKAGLCAVTEQELELAKSAKDAFDNHR